jgi:solute:Na+ symporter, SSS family
VAVIPIVFVVGLFGLAAVGLDRAQIPSVALFGVLLETLPQWLVVGLVVLGFALVMSSADTLFTASPVSSPWTYAGRCPKRMPGSC